MERAEIMDAPSIHLDGEDGKLISKPVFEDCPTRQEVMHEEVTPRETVCVEEKDRTLEGIVYEMIDKARTEVDLRVASPDIEGLFPWPKWDSMDVVGKAFEETQEFFSNFSVMTKNVEIAERTYREKRAEAIEILRGKKCTIGGKKKKKRGQLSRSRRDSLRRRCGLKKKWGQSGKKREEEEDQRKAEERKKRGEKGKRRKKRTGSPGFKCRGGREKESRAAESKKERISRTEDGWER
jgi:hypothetical protein